MTSRLERNTSGNLLPCSLESNGIDLKKKKRLNKKNKKGFHVKKKKKTNENLINLSQVVLLFSFFSVS